jgi:pSer/pThr/pTyr-binding forkhead associated (FHA) protein
MWILESTDPDNALLFRLTAGSLKTMGRSAGADFVVEAALVSRVHCRFTLDSSDGLGIEDLESTNGTWVNERKVTRARLTSGDTVRVGRVTFLVRHAAS